MIYIGQWYIYCGIFGYSDDNQLLALSLFGLQKMLTICEEFAEEQNLKLSTDENQATCKKKQSVQYFLTEIRK